MGDREAAREEFEGFADEVRLFCAPLCVAEDTTEAQAADYALQALERAEAMEVHVARITRALEEYAAHASWRCEYRSRYGKCVCGLDREMRYFGLEAVAVIDPEAAGVVVGRDTEGET